MSTYAERAGSRHALNRVAQDSGATISPPNGQDMPPQTLIPTEPPPIAPTVPQPNLKPRHGKRRFTAHSRFGFRKTPVKSYGALGPLEVRLAQSNADVRRAQRLRFQVFYREMSATASGTARLKRRDIDAYDTVCDHLLVVDHAGVPQSQPAPPPRFRATWAGRRPRVVGTYRMLRQDVVERVGSFYTQNEFDLAPLMAAKGATHRFMEVGRSCVLQQYRNKRTLELLWHGLWTYIREHDVTVMVGCASFEGTDPEAHAEALGFLHHHAAAPPEWHVRAHAHLRVDMNMLPAAKIRPRDAMKALPPLIKGYLRLGCFVGDGAVVDHQFGTTDVLMILPVERIDPRYFAHFGHPDERMARIGHPRVT